MTRNQVELKCHIFLFHCFKFPFIYTSALRFAGLDRTFLELSELIHSHC